MRTIRWVVHSYLKEKEKFRHVPQIKFFMHAVRRFMLEFIEIVFFSCKPMKKRHSYTIMFCVLSPLSCAQSHRVLPESYNNNNTWSDSRLLWSQTHVREPLPCPFVCGGYIISSAGPPPPPNTHTHPRGCDKLIFSGQFGPRSGPTKCLMFCSRNKVLIWLRVRYAGWSSNVTKSGYIHLQTCGK